MEPTSLTFEESLARLEQIARQLDDGKSPLEDSLRQYEEGVKLLRHGHTLLEGAKRRIETLRGIAEDDTPILDPVSEESVKTKVE